MRSGRPPRCDPEMYAAWLTSTVFCTTVATLMWIRPVCPRRAAADQLGHADTSRTTEVSFGREVAVRGATAVLEPPSLTA